MATQSIWYKDGGSSDDSSSSSLSDDETSEKVALAVALTAVASGFGEKEQRSCWSRQWLLNRGRPGAFSCLLQERFTEDTREVKAFLRMTHGNSAGVEYAGPLIEKKIPRMRKATFTLRFWGSGMFAHSALMLVKQSDYCPMSHGARASLFLAICFDFNTFESYKTS